MVCFSKILLKSKNQASARIWRKVSKTGKTVFITAFFILLFQLYSTKPDLVEREWTLNPNTEPTLPQVSVYSPIDLISPRLSFSTYRTSCLADNFCETEIWILKVYNTRQLFCISSWFLCHYCVSIQLTPNGTFLNQESCLETSCSR